MIQVRQEGQLFECLQEIGAGISDENINRILSERNVNCEKEKDSLEWAPIREYFSQKEVRLI
jgi:hypothetical protein